MLYFPSNNETIIILIYTCVKSGKIHMKKVVLDDTKVVCKGDHFVMLDGFQIADLIREKWFRMFYFVLTRYSLECRVQILFKDETFYPSIFPNMITENTSIECTGSKGSRLVIWHPYGSDRIAISIYEKVTL